jgi:hypothetical protein
VAKKHVNVFPCKEPKCKGVVTYRPEPVHGLGYTERVKRVYLTCVPNKHEHEYHIEV